MGMRDDAWSRDEVELIVADYFAMLRAELSRQPVNKAERNRRLQGRLTGRSKGSIEFKHANISAVLLNLGDLPYIDGYKPRGNYQQILEQVVLERLTIEPDFFDRLATAPVVSPESSAETDYTDLDALVEAPPEPFGDAGVHVGGQESRAGLRAARKVDFARVDAQNRRLGLLGEEWVLEFERRRLHDVEGRSDLAKKIVWTSVDEGDGAGFDIRSFNADESPRLIEVKSTGLGKYLPFYVTPHEVATSERFPSDYHLYRVFTLATNPRVYMLRGALSAVCHLRPSQYTARIGR
jgi:hypothetical protein